MKKVTAGLGNAGNTLMSLWNEWGWIGVAILIFGLFAVMAYMWMKQ